MRLADANFASAPPLYSGFIFNPADNTFKPLFAPVEGVMISDLVGLQARAPPWIKNTDLNNPLLADKGVGVLSIRSVLRLRRQRGAHRHGQPAAAPAPH